jgi:tetratricopeptide (TPR) repeat protein
VINNCLWKGFFKAVVVLAVATILPGCSLFGLKKDPVVAEGEQPPKIDPDLMADFNMGVKALDEERYPEAEGVFKTILTENPTNRFQLVVEYNLAAAYEGQKRCKEAGRGYRKVARASLGKFPRIEAQALYRLSFSYTCVGADEKAVVSLLDALRRKKHLQEEIAVAEIPARLASAYARLGNNEKAEVYYSDARRGIQYLRARFKNRRSLNDILAKTLFLMGRIAPIENRVQSNSIEYLSGLEYLQAYLLQAVEMNSEKWSPKAAEQISRAYDLVFKVVENPVGKPSRLSEQQKLRRNYQIATEALANLKLLKKNILPNITNNDKLVRLRAAVVERESKFKEFLALNTNETPLTENAEQKEGLKRDLKLKDP